MMQSSQTQTATLFQTMPLECPFAWRIESFLTSRKIDLFPPGADLTLSFTATRNSKIMGYLPIIGTILGIYRMYQSLLEYRHFDSIHLHYLSQRSFHWIIRGAIELLPIIGGIICIIADFIATQFLPRLPNPSSLPDETPCGYCHTCPAYCKC
jgi:hypothetical protein